MHTSILCLAIMAVAGAIAAPLERREPSELYTKCVNDKAFALTFDDGPYKYSWELATYLQEKGIKATFFMSGDNYENVETASTEDGKSYLDVIKHVYDAGHMIASHTYQHKDLVSLSEDEIREQVTKNADVIYRAINQRPLFLRPPAGSYNDRVLQILGELNVKAVTWDIDTLDWNSHDLNDEKSKYESAFDGDSQGGHIVLQHETYEQTVRELTPWAIDYVASKGYHFVDMAECLGFSSGYQ